LKFVRGLATGTGMAGENPVLALVQSLAPAVAYKESNFESNKKIWNLYAKVREPRRLPSVPRARLRTRTLTRGAQDWQPERDWVRKMADNLGEEWQVLHSCIMLGARAPPRAGSGLTLALSRLPLPKIAGGRKPAQVRGRRVERQKVARSGVRCTHRRAPSALLRAPARPCHPRGRLALRPRTGDSCRSLNPQSVRAGAGGVCASLLPARRRLGRDRMWWRPRSRARHTALQPILLL